jgi:CDP-diacylglycerol--glycerol-3-phosphate 3-phosphatidyltransferase
MSKLEKYRRSVVGRFTPFFVRLLARTSLSPNILTWLGLLFTVGAAVLVVTNHFLAAGIVVLVAGLFDLLDGALARFTNRVSRFGGILDSSLDRISEAVLLIGLMVVFTRDRHTAAVLLVGATLVGSFMVSYIRARMEGAGIACKAGIFTRPERVVLLALGLMLNCFTNALLIILGIIAFFSWVTFIERLIFAWNHTKA